MAELDFGVVGKLVSSFTSDTRLYSLEGAAPLDTLQVERWSGEEALSTCYAWHVHALSLDADLPLEALLGQRAALRTTLANGTRSLRSGLIREAECVGADGGLARYRLVLVPWLWLLTQGRHSRVFQDQGVGDIIATVFAGYGDRAAWRLTADAQGAIAALRPRSYCVQYRESDYAFVSRLLAEEGLGFRFEEDDQAPAGHRLVLFADSRQLPDDPSAAEGPQGLRFHRADGTEAADTIQAMGQDRQLSAAAVTLLSHDYKTLQVTASTLALAGTTGPRELYDPVGAYAFADAREAEAHARRHAEALDVRRQAWRGRGTVRTARAGAGFHLSDLPAAEGGTDTASTDFLWTTLTHAGVNNLPTTLLAAVQARLGPVAARGDAAVWAQAERGGYGQGFTAVARTLPWRPALTDATGRRLNPRPTAPGVQSAIVVGPQGETQAGASGPLHCDALGRLRVRFHWQRPDDTGACWLRVAQRYAGSGLGAQFLPRIGQEVLVGFLDGDIDRPLIVGALYNGQGEAGIAPTPGGASATSDTAAYAQAADHRPSAQGNLAGGHSPAWHGLGAGAEQHGHAAALSGLKSQGFDGNGHNQLVFDDSDGQGRVQFASTQAMSQLNLGHLIHQADNYRGSFRGQGFELRTDAWGAVRAERGLLLSSYAAGPATPAGDATGAGALLRQHGALATALSQAAQSHLTVPLASAQGVQQANQSRLVTDQAPLAALQKTVATTVDGSRLEQGVADAPARQSGSEGTLPHSGDAVLGLAARGGQAILAGQSLHWSAGETLALGSGQDTNLAVNHQLRIHSGQAIGWLAGAQQAQGVGLSLVASQGALDVQAQHATLALRAKGELTLVSANAETELAAAKTIHLAVSGGAHVLIDGGNITFGCPGNLTVHAGKKSFVGPAQLDRKLSMQPKSDPFKLKYVVRNHKGEPLKDTPYALVMQDGSVKSGRTDASGHTQQVLTDGPELVHLMVDNGEHEGFYAVPAEA